MRNIVIFFVLLCSFSCAEKEATNVETSFFDISQFVDSMLVKNQIQDQVHRTITIDEETEEKTLTDVDMTEILGFLKQFNINRPRWYDKYTVAKTGNVTTYTLLDEDLDVKKLSVERTAEEISKINVLYKSKTLISSSEKNISWMPTNNLTINNVSNSLWSAEQKMDINWKYSQ